MNTLIDRLKTFNFFEELSPKTLRAVARAGQVQTICGGGVIYRQGDPADRLYFVLSGRLVVARDTPAGESIVGYIGTGEPVGEMSLILDERHSATVYALRDTDVLAVSHEDFDTLHATRADLAAQLSRYMLARSKRLPINLKRSAPKLFAFIGSSPSIDIDGHARKLADAVRALGFKVDVCTEPDEVPGTAEFDDQEADHDVVILSARVGDTPWYRFVLRHADRFFVFARRDAMPPRPFPLSPDESAPARRFRLVDLVMLEEGSRACAVTDWRDAVGAKRVFHWRDDKALARLARVITGQSVGIVLSGGGARAYAHIGAVRAMREAGIPIDFTCGASMGGIIAACIALGWSDEEMDYRVKAAFVESNPLSDFRLPVVALTRGCIVEERLKAHFGDALIEEMDLPFFCVSAELTQGVAYVHRDGILRDALRASISLPGILPPVVDGEKLLVDGGLINNFPTDIMSAMHRGQNIGIDVAREGTIDPKDYMDAPGFFRWIRKHGLKAAPPIVGLLMRSATTRRESTMLYHPADIMITPDVDGVDLRSWKEYDRAVEEGYEATRAVLDEQWSSPAKGEPLKGTIEVPVEMPVS